MKELPPPKVILIQDVPRTAKGWPTVGPEHFTLEQLVYEAQQWVGGHPNTCKENQWNKYTTELVRRGFIDEVDVKRWARFKVAPDIRLVGGDWFALFPPVK